MSERFTLRCDTCAAYGRTDAELVDAPECWKNGRELVLQLIADAPALLALWARTRREYEIHAWWGRVPLHWLEEHRGHVLRPISELEPRT